MTSYPTYEMIMSERAAIMRASVGIDYDQYVTGPLSFDYERLLSDTGYALDDVRAIQMQTAVGNTPLVELKRLTALVRSIAPPNKGGNSSSRTRRQILPDRSRTVVRRCPCIERNRRAMPAL